MQFGEDKFKRNREGNILVPSYAEQDIEITQSKSKFA